MKRKKIFNTQGAFLKVLETKTNFKGYKFNCKIYLKGRDIKSLFDNSIFEKDVTIEECDLYTSSFSQCIFKGALIIRKSHFHNKADFFRAIFEKGLISVNNIFEEIVVFDKVDFNDKVLVYNNCFIKETSINTTVFNKYAYFDNTMFQDKLSLVDTKCLNQISFRKSVFLNKIYIHRSSFGKRVDFEKAIVNQLECNSSTLYSNFILSETIIFGAINIISVIVKGLFDARNIRITNKELDIQSEINEVIKGELLNHKAFVYPNYEKNVRVDFSDSIFNNLSINNLQQENFKNRETLNAIKHSFFKRGDRVKGMKFHRMEMIQYSDEIKKEIKSQIGLKNKIKILGELFLISMNRLSNKHGNSWERGVLFTIFASVIFFTLFMCCIWSEWDFNFNANTLGNTLKAFLQFLNVTNWNYEPFGISNYNWAYIPLFIGRIFISFGIYQTIEAFRKYGKV